ncbi:MAG: NUDIX hydrolase [Planctomycetes bacterium]|nr:NUDIX hydrolase [Planctomycetota bacterium]
MHAHGPWQILKSHDVYRDAWLHVRKDDVLRPDGKPGTHSAVFLRPGVSVLALGADRQVFLTEEFHYAVGRVTLEVVSGGREADELPLVAARRELEEELGIQADEWTALGTIDPFTTMLNGPADLFLARGLHFGETRLDATEQIRCVSVDFLEAVQMVQDGRITHAPSCTLILKVALWLQQHDPKVVQGMFPLPGI